MNNILKKIKYLFFILIIIQFYSCIDDSPPDPPKVTISPEIIMEISPINDVVYTITASSPEELVNFKLTCSPSIFKMDSSFASLVHTITFKTKLKLPEITATLPDDSIITLSFQISDTENSTIITRSIKIVPGYTGIYQFTSELNAPPDSNFLYSTINNETFILDSLDNEATDIVFIYDPELGYTLCSPDANWISEKLLEFDLEYSTENKNHTKLKTITGSWEIMNFEYIYKLNLTEENINDIPSNGVGVDEITTDNIIAFETHDGRKGVLKITELSKEAEKISFELKVQKE